MNDVAHCVSWKLVTTKRARLVAAAARNVVHKLVITVVACIIIVAVIAIVVGGGDVGVVVHIFVLYVGQAFSFALNAVVMRVAT